MIIDTSALVAVSRLEPHHEPLLAALTTEDGFIPAPCITEFRLVMALPGNEPDEDAEAILTDLLAGRTQVLPYSAEDAAATFAAIQIFGRGNGRGGMLNFGDLMVYGMAKRRDLPILCTGRDFTATDARIHPASRTS